MLNLDFFAVGSDLNVVLDFVFHQSGCRAFEGYSAFGHDLIGFSTVACLMTKLHVGTCRSDGDRTFLQLVVPSASSLYTVRRIELAPDKCGGHSFRYTIEGWGLIQLYLGGIG